MPGQPSGRKAFRAKRVFTATSDTAIDDGLLLVDQGRITWVGRAADADPFDGPVRDFGDVTLLPGLVDAHCHLTLPGDKRTYEQVDTEPDEMLAMISVANLRRHMSCGVTTVRDNGGRNRVTFMVRRAVQHGYVDGPRMLLAGRPITHSLGHFYFCNGTADGPDEIRAAVRMLVAEGADHIKIMASGGATLGNLPYYAAYTADEMKVAVDAAHELGRLTTGHCRATTSMRYAVAAGLDCVEHAEFLEPDFSRGARTQAHSNLQGGQTVYDPELAEQMLKSGMYVSYTLQCGGYDTVVELREKREKEGLSELEMANLDALQFYFDQKLGVLGHMLRDGFTGRLAISSDAGPFDTRFGEMHHGFELAVMAGMTTAEALRAGTQVAANLCGVGDEVGTLEAGKVADFFVVDGDPLNDIRDIAKVTGVYADGILKSRGIHEYDVPE